MEHILAVKAFVNIEAFHVSIIGWRAYNVCLFDILIMFLGVKMIMDTIWNYAVCGFGKSCMGQEGVSKGKKVKEMYEA